MTRVANSLALISISLLVALGMAACTPPHDHADANAIEGTGYPVDSRDMITKAYKPLNGMEVGDTQNPDSPKAKK